MEEIEEIDESLADPFFADAIENERELALTEEQKKNYIRVLYFYLTSFISVNKHATFESITVSGCSLCSCFYRFCNEICILNTI